MANRRFKVKVTVEADFEIVVDDEIFNEKLADGISDGFHPIDYDEDKPAIQALVEDVAELYLRTTRKKCLVRRNHRTAVVLPSNASVRIMLKLNLKK